VSVPSVGGSSLADATAQLRALGLRVSSSEQPVTDPAQDGTVIGQDPSPGTEVQRGSRVSLTVGRVEAGTNDGGNGLPGDTTTQPQPGADQGPGQGPAQGQGQGQGDPLGDIFG
jgi:serine/threonine-protein kinase